jgi:hypothetical protein
MLNGYNSDLEEFNLDSINGGSKKKKYRKTKKSNSLFTKKTFKRDIPTEYKNSIYYDTKKFDALTKHILNSNLLTNINNNDKIDSEFEKVINEATNKKTKKQTMSSSQTISISVNKSNINGKTHEIAKITVNNGNKPYIQEYTYIDGKKKVKKIKK